MSTHVSALDRDLAPTTAERPRGLRVDTLLSGAVAMLVLTTVQRAAGFVRELLFCRWLEPDELGLWDMAWGFLVLAAPLAVLSVPGAFGRYVEHYRQQGQLWGFLRKTALFCMATTTLAALGLLAARGPWAFWVFGDAQHAELMTALVGCLVVMIVYQFLTCVLGALRCIRLVAILEFFNSIGFAAVAVTLAAAWQATATSIVLGYTLACLGCAVLAFVWLGRALHDAPVEASAPSAPAIWSRIASFTVGLMVTSLLLNLFSIADRYVIVHCYDGTAEEAMALVGQYRSARVLPLLVASVSGLLANILLPYLSHDWEAGRRERVGQRLNSFLKLTGVALSVAALALTAVAPWLFSFGFANKYAAGLSVLPWTFVAAIWFGVVLIAQQYLWCAERAGLVCLAALLALVASVSLNLLLLPALGLLGTVLATAAAHLLAAAVVLGFAAWAGLKIERGVWIAAALPLSLPLGVLPATIVHVLVLGFGWRWLGLFTSAQKHEISGHIHVVLHHAQGWWRWLCGPLGSDRSDRSG